MLDSSLLLPDGLTRDELAEKLENIMTNKGQQQRLIECLAAMGTVEVGHG